ncbi:hypothetical protein CKAN_01222600 [Cinnamomum micranthum f. kanehirae]|uniref:Uncharacterized protein n=1 Tax=Cinnamomum micranthum f. kanehirae TaxID=337451 RepID=A0A3S3QD44_9MAGN|nr:hypothetical protein CKAN_01222600 [Cinnamomum micranthum f. kanehirae]
MQIETLASPSDPSTPTRASRLHHLPCGLTDSMAKSGVDRSFPLLVERFEGEFLFGLEERIFVGVFEVFGSLSLSLIFVFEVGLATTPTFRPVSQGIKKRFQ